MNILQKQSDRIIVGTLFTLILNISACALNNGEVKSEPQAVAGAKPSDNATTPDGEIPSEEFFSLEAARYAADKMETASNISSINLQDYLPAHFSKTTKFAKWYGGLSQVYRFFPATPDFMKVYLNFQNINKPGSLLIWEKRSNKTAAGADQPLGNCVNTYGMLWMGTDQSVVEVGDWMPQKGSCNPSIAFAYRDYKTNKNGGISWSGPNGLTKNGTSDVVWTKSQNTPGKALVESGWMAYSHSKLIAVLPSFTPEYGRNSQGVWTKGAGKTYKNVAQILFLHGVRNSKIANFSAPRCPIDSNSPYARWYFSVKGFKSYASLYHLAPKEGIIQMTFLSNESDNYWPKEFQCKGYAFSNPKSTETSPDVFSFSGTWVEMIDESP